jgi:integrase
MNSQTRSAVMTLAGRPALRIGQHGRITREQISTGVWVARCRYRDADGVTRRVARWSPADTPDQYGKLAEDALVASLADRRPPGDPGEVTADTRVQALIDRHLERLKDDDKSPITIATYEGATGRFEKFIGAIVVRDATPARIDAALRSMRSAHGATMARQTRTVLKGALQLAVMAGVINSNPVRDVQVPRAKTPPKQAPGLTAEQLRELLTAIRASEDCQRLDLADPITVLLATGLRRSELLALRWQDFDADADAATLAITGKVVRVPGKPLERIETTKTTAGRRVVPLPAFAVTVLTARRGRPFIGEQEMIFPSTAGTWRDGNNLGKQWRKVRDDLGVPDVSSHSFRRSLATLIDDGGLSALVGADHLGHERVSTTQDIYQSRGRVHTAVAELLDRTINGE